MNHIHQEYLPSYLMSSLKHANHSIFWSTPSTSFYEARQAHKHAKFIEHDSSTGTLFRKVLQAREHLKHASTPST